MEYRMVKRPLIFGLLLISACKTYSFSRDNRPCDSDGSCIAGYVCQNNVCVRDSGCVAGVEIPCNGIDEDCDGADLQTVGTPQNCAACGDVCGGAHVQGSACVSSVCTITHCESGFGNMDADTKNGCEATCVNRDGDILCDDADTCIDADGDGLGDGSKGNTGCANTTTDINDGNKQVCGDTDSDGCDDCASGTFDSASDGIDRNHDGICNVNQADEDGDGRGWANGDPDDGNPSLCGDVNGDTCDECTLAQQVDCDLDGLCDSAPSEVDDIDGDGVSHFLEGQRGTSDCDPHQCGDVDSDGCEDCSKFDLYGHTNPLDDGDVDADKDGICGDGTTLTNPLRDCDDGVPTCSLPGCSDDKVTSGPNANLPRCLVKYCLAQANDPTGSLIDPDTATNTCRVVTQRSQLNALTSANPAVDTLYFIFFDGNPGDTLDMGNTVVNFNNSNSHFILHQRQNLTLEFSSTTAFRAQSSAANELHELHVRGYTLIGTNLDTGFLLQTSNNVVNGCSLSSYNNRGIAVSGGNGNTLTFNTLEAPLGDYVSTSTRANIAITGAVNTLVRGNTLRQGKPTAIVASDTSGTTIESNTVSSDPSTSDAEGPALSFLGGDPTNNGAACVRRNVFLRENVSTTNVSQSLVLTELSDSFQTLGASCTSGDNFINETGGYRCGGACDMGGMEECGCLPSGFFSTTTVARSDFSADLTCPLTAPVLNVFTQANDPNHLGSRVSATSSPRFNGAGAEPGAREAGTPWCPGP
jgi:hypothetical protein